MENLPRNKNRLITFHIMTHRSVISSSSNFTLHLFVPRNAPEILQFNISDALIPLQSLPPPFAHPNAVHGSSETLKYHYRGHNVRLWKIVLDKRATDLSDSGLPFHGTEFISWHRV